MESSKNINVVGICGSLRKGSTTHSALTLALNGAREAGASVELLDLTEYDLVFHGSSQYEQGYPEDVNRLKNKITRAQGILLGTPEYHSSFSGVLKNALDLMGYGEFQNKVVGLIGVSGGRMGANNALSMLRIVCSSLGAWVVPSEVSIPRASEVIDENGNINDTELEKRVKAIGQQVTKFAAIWKSEQNEYD